MIDRHCICAHRKTEYKRKLVILIMQILMKRSKCNFSNISQGKKYFKIYRMIAHIGKYIKSQKNVTIINLHIYNKYL